MTEPTETDMAETTNRITQVTRDGLTFDVDDDGPIAGDLVVLLHGFPERSTSWRLVAPQLHTAGLRTLAMDQRGYSTGARPKRRRDYRVNELIADVVALIDAAAPGRRVHVVGHDWGAVVAWGIAQQHPDRVATLTAVSVPHPMAFVTAMVRSGQLLKSWYMFAFQAPRLPELLLGRLQKASDRQLAATGMTRDDLERVRTEIIDDGALPGALGWYRALLLNNPADIRRRVTVPTTFVWSDGDVAIGPWGAEHSGDWVDAPYTYVELAGVSHWIPTQAPDALAEAILEQVSGRSDEQGEA
ncbi:MAG TPA: alpha/beta fold hydrolase [Acidimicrobiales bacterium]